MVERKTQPVEKDTRDRRSLTMSEPKASKPVLDRNLSAASLDPGSVVYESVGRIRIRNKFVQRRFFFGPK
jgi:hypothetical protein